MLERELEKDAREQIKAQGGLMLKWVSPGKKGVPDDIVFWPRGVIHLIEFKKPGEDLKPHQVLVHEDLAVFKPPIFVISTHGELNIYLGRFGHGKAVQNPKSR